ncbi:hypothetical protein CDL12_15314 [Handroanthus impetiginosus]|uniref:Uncharacterized protein n=1 Tax=Handroanthus impetiginosus TaxID=429701 RepID=A0A2G9H3G6_9LAMI|nr:hypothetical protein CDL12_15314 [Handroanthus impetiginosus]
MNSKKCSLRPIGQRSIKSTFLFRASNRSIDCKKNVELKKPSGKGLGLSLSDYLNRKLHRSSVLPSSVQDKEKPFSSPLSGEDSDRIAQRQSVKKEGGEAEAEAEAKFSIDDAFYMFKSVENVKNSSRNSYSTNESEILDADDFQQETRKRKHLFEGHDDNLPPKRLVVLGEDPKPRKSSRRMNFRREEPKPLFNHYENGGGWWDDNMEGVDNEEVGFNDVWEGVGSTTLGGIEWH